MRSWAEAPHGSRPGDPGRGGGRSSSLRRSDDIHERVGSRGPLAARLLRSGSSGQSSSCTTTSTSPSGVSGSRWVGERGQQRGPLHRICPRDQGLQPSQARCRAPTGSDGSGRLRPAPVHQGGARRGRAHHRGRRRCRRALANRTGPCPGDGCLAWSRTVDLTAGISGSCPHRAGSARLASALDVSGRQAHPIRRAPRSRLLRDAQCMGHRIGPHSRIAWVRGDRHDQLGARRFLRADGSAGDARGAAGSRGNVGGGGRGACQR